MNLAATDFERGVGAAYAGGADGFTMFVILLKRSLSGAMTPLCSIPMIVDRAAFDFADFHERLFASGLDWDAVALIAQRDKRTGGPLDHSTARIVLLEQEAAFAKGDIALWSAPLFDATGARYISTGPAAP